MGLSSIQYIEYQGKRRMVVKRDPKSQLRFFASALSTYELMRSGIFAADVEEQIQTAHCANQPWYVILASLDSDGTQYTYSVAALDTKRTDDGLYAIKERIDITRQVLIDEMLLDL